jgi:hypothetical protein
MRSLGIFGGVNRLPSLAFNTNDERKVAYPERAHISGSHLLRFCAAYLSGALRETADANRLALTEIVPSGGAQGLIPKRKRVQAAPEQVC